MLVNYGYDYLTKSKEELNRTGIEYSAFVLPGASCGVEYVDTGMTEEEEIQELCDLLNEVYGELDRLKRDRESLGGDDAVSKEEIDDDNRVGQSEQNSTDGQNEEDNGINS